MVEASRVIMVPGLFRIRANHNPTYFIYIFFIEAAVEHKFHNNIGMTTL